MKDKRILCVSSEVAPYLAENEVSSSKKTFQKWQTRVVWVVKGLMAVNLDMPLIIKVINSEKKEFRFILSIMMKVSNAKSDFADEGVLYPETKEQYFAKGVVETVKN